MADISNLTFEAMGSMNAEDYKKQLKELQDEVIYEKTHGNDKDKITALRKKIEELNTRWANSGTPVSMDATRPTKQDISKVHKGIKRTLAADGADAASNELEQITKQYIKIITQQGGSVSFGVNGDVIIDKEHSKLPEAIALKKLYNSIIPGNNVASKVSNAKNKELSKVASATGYSPFKAEAQLNDSRSIPTEAYKLGEEYGNALANGFIADKQQDENAIKVYDARIEQLSPAVTSMLSQGQDSVVLLCYGVWVALSNIREITAAPTYARKLKELINRYGLM